MRRIRIIGGPGSGKTYLGEHLSAALGLPVVRLDRIYYASDAKTRGVPAPARQRDEQLREALANEEWIVEGHWGDWANPSALQADAIVALRPSARKRTLNILRRHVLRRVGRIKGRPESFAELRRLLAWGKHYDMTLATLLAEFRAAGKDVREFPDADAALRALARERKD